MKPSLVGLAGEVETLPTQNLADNQDSYSLVRILNALVKQIKFSRKDREFSLLNMKVIHLFLVS